MRELRGRILKRQITIVETYNGEIYFQRLLVYLTESGALIRKTPVKIGISISRLRDVKSVVL